MSSKSSSLLECKRYFLMLYLTQQIFHLFQEKEITKKQLDTFYFACLECPLLYLVKILFRLGMGCFEAGFLSSGCLETYFVDQAGLQFIESHLPLKILKILQNLKILYSERTSISWLQAQKVARKHSTVYGLAGFLGGADWL